MPRPAGADFTTVGIAVGHATDEAGATGCTVIRGVDGALRGAAAVIGRATGTRDLLTVTSHHLVDRVDAIFLSGGSAYGLDACAGVMRWMEERGRGFPVGGGVVPIVPGAVVFDLEPLGRFDARPTTQMAWEACERASPTDISEGSVGAGTGTTVGKVAGPGRSMKGGVGCAVVRAGEGSLAVAALAVTNALGDIRDADGRIVAGTRGDRGFADSARMLGSGPPPAFAALQMRNTTLAVVALNATLSRPDLGAVAAAASAALHRRITPCGTAYDGDVVFALAPLAGEPTDTVRASVIAAAALEEAIERSVRMARGRDGVPGLADHA